MARKRIIETSEGIQDPVTVEIFDRFARTMRKKGYDNVDKIIKTGIIGGRVLEIGPGPGHVGLHWLEKNSDARLVGCEISSEMIKTARKNARGCGLEDRVQYVEGSCLAMPFDGETFDAVFSNGSLHEWEDPVRVFQEIHRVLRPGGLFCSTDMRRDANPFLKWFIYATTRPKEIRPGFLSSFNASYTVPEMKEIIARSPFPKAAVTKDVFGLWVTGRK